MKNLWAPWRMSYILGQETLPTGCIFDFAKDKSHDQKNLILFRDSLTVILLNRFPYANGHLLVAPARHVAEMTDLHQQENHALIDLIQQSVSIIKKHLRPDGFNIGLNLGEVAGAGLADHLHFHVIPRWNGDHNFMTVIGEIRSIPEHIDNTFDKLLPDFQKLTKTTN
ncbi:MAG: HIT domain-containing protein [Proteobacteria bacterium]|nr:HIT domain-containing protein [Pseudomonadota bacterium]MBU1716426.1 HIT domain-containing protein [Pseudomonadota bacterium]